MRITNIKATNFKGRSFNTELSPITVLVGQNFTGKSSRTEAMALALAGYLPGIEKTPGKITDRLASGNPMSVSVEFDDGRYMGREYTKDGSKVSCKINQRGFHAAWAVEPVVIDSLEFLGLSAKERVKFLVSNLPMTGEVVTPASLFERLSKQDIAKSEEAALLIGNLETEVSNDHERAVTAGLSPQLWLESLSLNLNEQRKQRAARQLELAKAHKIENENQQPMTAYSKTAVNQRCADSEKALAKAQDDLNNAKVKQRSLSAALDYHKEERELALKEQVLKSARDALKQAMRELGEVKSLECCPKCGAKNKGWQEKIERAAQLDVAEFERQAGKAGDAVIKCSDAFKEKKRTIEALNAQQADKLAKEVAKAQAALDKSDAEHERAIFEQSAMNRQEDEIKRREKSRKEAVTVNTEVEVLKALCGITAEALDAMVSGSIGPFVARINALCGDVLLHPVAYRDGELGMDTGKLFVTWKSFSGTEKALFQCAVSLALTAEAEIKLAVLDEVGRLDNQNKVKLASKIHALIESGTIKQAILIDASDLPMWKRIESDNLAVVEIK